MATQTPSPKPFFGRRKDYDRLRARIDTPGMTAVLGRPQIGKTRLVTELRDRLRVLDDPNRPLVGYNRAGSDTINHLLYALRDLNQHDWLEQAGFIEQAKRLRPKMEGLIARIGKTFGTTLAPFLSIIDPTGGLGTAVGGTFDALKKADDDLRTGGLDLRPIAAEQAKALLQILHAVSGRPLLLILDAFEQQQYVDREIGQLRSWLSEMEDWPPLHVIVVAREPGQDEEEDAAHRAIMKLHAGYSPMAGVQSLGPMDLSNAEEQDALVLHLQHHAPAAARMDAAECLALVAGNPGALHRIVQGKPESAEAMQAIAKDARNYHYPEVERILRDLRANHRALFDLAIRLALLPEIDSRETWNLYRTAFQLQGSETADLHNCGLLEDGHYPHFGHTKRFQTLSHALQNEFEADASSQAERLIVLLAASCTAGEASDAHRAKVLITLLDEHDWLQLAPSTQNYLKFVRGGMGLVAFEDGPVEEAVSYTLDAPAVAGLTSLALFYAASDAKARNDVPQSDVLLEQLRHLHDSLADDSTVREHLAMALVNYLNHTWTMTPKCKRDAVLEELRTIHLRFEDDTAMLALFAMGLFSTLVHASHEGDLDRRDAVLKELRYLQESFAESGAVCEWAAKGCFNIGLERVRAGHNTEGFSMLEESLELLRNGGTTDLQPRWPRQSPESSLLGMTTSDERRGMIGIGKTPETGLNVSWGAFCGTCVVLALSSAPALADGFGGTALGSTFVAMKKAESTKGMAPYSGRRSVWAMCAAT